MSTKGKHNKQSTINENKLTFSLSQLLLICLTVSITTSAILVALIPRFSQIDQPNYKTSPSEVKIPYEYQQTLLRKLEKESLEEHLTHEYSSIGELQTLWQTPLMSTNIAVMIGPQDVDQFNLKLSKEILRGFGTSKKQSFQNSLKSWNQLKSDEIVLLKQFIHVGIEKYLKTLKKTEISIKPTNLEIWATIYETGYSKLASYDQQSILSGIYFVDVVNSMFDIEKDFDNEQSEEGKKMKLLLDDPRGPLPPFEAKMNLDALKGDLFIFPSWITKQVVPVIGKKSIVVNFRLLGPENSLSEVNDIFPLE